MIVAVLMLLLIWSNAAEGVKSAIHGNNCASHERGRGGKQPQAGPDQILRIAETPHGSMGNDGFSTSGQIAGLLFRKQKTILLRQEKSRGYRVNSNVRRVLLRQMNREPLREISNSGLGG